MGANEIGIIMGCLLGGTFLLSPVFIVSIIVRHREKMKAMDQGSKAPTLVAELAALREEMKAMRETSTKFDMSLDAAIDRLESRMERVERQSTVAPTGTTRTVVPEEPPVQINMGRY